MSVAELSKVFFESVLGLGWSLFSEAFKSFLSLSVCKSVFLSELLMTFSGIFEVYFFVADDASGVLFSPLLRGTVCKAVLSPAEAPQPISQIINLL